MNTKEKDELREFLEFSIKDNAEYDQLSPKVCEYLLKAIEAFEHLQPLDAGEADERKEKDFINDRYGISDEDHQTALEPGHIYDLMTAFAQASITAKEKEWEREKAELLEEAKYCASEIAQFHDLRHEVHCYLNALNRGDQKAVEYRTNKMEELLKHTNE